MGANLDDCGGFGIVARRVSREMVERIFCEGAALGRSVVKLDGSSAGWKYPQRRSAATIPFTLLPGTLFEESEWLPISAGRWRFADHITLGEGRAALMVLELLASEVLAHNHLVFSFEDN